MDRWMDRWTDGWMDGWMDGWIEMVLTNMQGSSLVDYYKIRVGVFNEKYGVIHKPLQKFRTRLRNKQDRHSRKEHTNR